MSELPEGWVEAPLEDLVTHILGGDWGSDPASSDPGLVDVAVVRGADFKYWQLVRAKNAAHRKIDGKSLIKRRLLLGDLVVEVSGGGPTQPVGRVLLVDADALASRREPLICANFCRQLRLDHRIAEPRFSAAALRYAYLRGDLDALQSETTNLRNLNVPRFLSETLHPPGRAHQKLINSDHLARDGDGGRLA
jgi:type I restriction enzyme, S subunit